ncbi:hypothetical protein VTK73DRAFT_6798 [Phialemonium thermophilum]|uniref:Uncharacterized protein n=1 Tax=Phialemonium thermophilum TaxID=223376 RepID=A0ABR3Y7X4_9PEZI
MRFPPTLQISQSLEPSSPPQTPVHASRVMNRENDLSDIRGYRSLDRSASGSSTMHYPPNIKPLGNGSSFSFSRPSHPNPKQLSPQSSSHQSSGSSCGAEDTESEVSEVPESPPPSPPRAFNTRIATHATFTVEELSERDDSADDELEVVRPYTIEDADSERSRSRSRNPPEIDRTVMYKFQHLDCDDSSSDETDLDETECQEYLKELRAEKRKKRLSSGSIGKRTISESIGSDTDREDMRVFLGVDQVGSSARRLRRKLNRHSLQFSDPPLPRIDQMEEPPTSDDEFLDDEALKELPYYTLDYITMEVDSP